MSATNRGATRNERDFYATPLEAFDPLICYLPKYSLIWEPACGDGRLIERMHRFGLNSFGADIEPNCPHLDFVEQRNFLTDTTKRECILTNPPFSLAMEFCAHAVKQAPRVFMLLRLNFLASTKRAEWFRANEPDALFILTKRPSFTGDGKTDATDYAWFYWGDLHKGIIHL